MYENLEQLLKSLVGNDKKITITIEPANGMTAEQIEKARKAGHEGKEIRL
jgi:hypothetical protein